VLATFTNSPMHRVLSLTKRALPSSSVEAFSSVGAEAAVTCRRGKRCELRVTHMHQRRVISALQIDVRLIFDAVVDNSMETVAFANWRNGAWHAVLDRPQISKGSNAAHRVFSKLFSSERSLLRLSSMCPSIMRPHGAKAANSAGRTFERPRASPNSLTNPAIHNNPVIKPELVEFA